MAIENINDYAGMWANGVNIGQMWDLIKAKFVSGAHNQSGSAYTQEWRVRARNNIGLPSLAAGQMWYALSADTLSVMDTTAMGRGLLNKGITKNAIWYGSNTNTIGEIVTSQVGRDVLVTTGASAVANLWATKATTDSRDSVIINTYGTDLAFDGNMLKLKNNASTKAFIGTGIETNANSGLVRLTGGKIPLSVFPDAILGQLTFGGNITSYDSTDDGLVVSLTGSAKAILEERSGKSLTGKVVVLVATSTKPADTGQYVFFNYADCKGMYFIWTDSALETHTGETVKYRIWPSGGPRYQAGDWMNSLETKWDKVDNTDAVTGVKGNAESVYRLGLVNITAKNVRALDTGLPNEIQNVQGKVEFEKDIWSLGGVAAYGISDLSMGGGGGGGLSGSILRNWASYDPNDETQILGSNLGIESFRMTGAKFQFMRNKTWTDGFTLADSNIPDLPLTKITGTDDLRAIEALSSTGILKRTGNNTWALRDAAGLRSDAGITGDIYTHNYSEFVTAVSISGTNLIVTKNGQATTTAINAATLQGHAADYFATQEALEGAVSTLSGGIGQVLAMAQDNAENIGSHDDRITDLESYFDGASVKNALDADKVDGHHASEFVGALGVSGNDLTWTKIGGTAQKITIPYASNAGQLGGVALGGLFTLLANDNKQLSATIGGVNKKLTLDYAKESTVLETEPLPNQEFIFRNSPKTVGADSLKLDRILGRTLVWNQIQRYAHNFSSGMISPSNCNVSYSNGVATITGSASSSMQSFLMTGISATPFVVGHKYIALITYTSTIGAQVYWSGGSGSFGNIPTKDSIYTYKLVATNNYATGPTGFGFYVDAPQSNWETKLYSLSSIDMTLLYGSEIDGMTNAEILAKFEKDYPNAYYEYNEGQLINNSAEGLETVGLNLWDEEWEGGSYNVWTDGSKNDSTAADYTRSKHFIECLPSTKYYFKGVASQQYRILQYDANKVYLGSTNGFVEVVNGEITTNASARYFTFYYPVAGGNDNRCINLSNPSKNGQYEPYKRSVLDLHLEEFKVKDSQGNIITITGGLKQAGNVRDEIVGGKYIRRVETADLSQMAWIWESGNSQVYSNSLTNSVKDGAFGSAGVICDKLEVNTNGYADMATVHVRGFNNKYLYISTPSQLSASDFVGYHINYELATPETYDLVSPIPTAMLAGTTERRLPEDTSDSVLAPFACDMTYGTNPGDILASGIAWERIWGRPTLEKGSLSDALVSADANNGEWFKLEMGGQILYVKFVVGEGAFKLQLADNDQNPTLSKEFEFATLSTADINAICV